MKKLLSVVLAAATLAAALASCAFSPEKAASAVITVTSSDASGAAEWLYKRLGDKLTDRVVLGTQTDGFGADVSTLEDDGYIIRTLGGEIALFAKTTDGLDRAVRRFAKTVESGAKVSDETYHEGYRVKRVELSGREISEYTIYSEEEPNMLAAANEFAALVKKACGADLAVSTAEPDVPCIIMKYVEDGSLSTCGYRWSTSGAGLTVECSDAFKPSSAHFAVLRFLENEFGWFGLSYGYESLAETDLISIPEGKSGGETNSLLFANLYGDFYSAGVGDGFEHQYDYNLTNNFSGLRNCCHGLQNNRFAGDLSENGDAPWSTDQPCYLSEDFFEAVYDDVLEFIENHIAAGAVIGEDFCNVDIAAGDNLNWCKCKKCRNMFFSEGNTEAGAVVTWANRLSEALEEVHPGIKYGIFAYAGTNKPPKNVRPNDLLAITYCFDMSCDTHPHDGSMCEGDLLNHVSYVSYPSLKDHNNVFMGENLRGWTEISDCVFVWFYGMNAGLVTMDFIHTVRADIRFFYDLGVIGIMWEAEDYGYSTNKVAKWLLSGLIWDIGMSDEEYDAFYRRVLETLYGDGWEYVKEFISAVDSIYESGPCLHGWGGYLVEPMWEKRFDALFELLESALLLACSEKQEKRLMKVDMSLIYCGCVSSFFPAKESGDGERLAELERRYQLILERSREFSLRTGSLKKSDVVVDLVDNLAPDLEIEAWVLHDAYGWHYRPDKSLMPERVAAYAAED